MKRKLMFRDELLRAYYGYVTGVNIYGTSRTLSGSILSSGLVLTSLTWQDHPFMAAGTQEESPFYG
jgi:hypothetical protein